MVEVRFKPLANIRGRKGDQGEKGDTGTFEAATAVSIPADQPARAEVYGPRGQFVRLFIPRGLPGVNALENDAAVAEYIAALDSQTRASLEKFFTPKDVLQYIASDHGVLGNGTSDDTATMQALIDHVPDGSTIVAPPGATYRTRGWTITEKSVILDFSNARLVKLGEGAILEATGAWDVIQSAAYESRSAVKVTDSSQFKVGDMVKVFSSDVMWDGRPRDETGEKPRQGEFAVIREIPDGQTLRITPGLEDTYSINVRVARMAEHNVQVRFGTATYEAPASSAMFRFRSLPFPVLEGRVLSAPGSVVGINSCYGARTNITATRLPAGDGYVVSSNASAFGDHYIVASRCRHAYTDAHSAHDGTATDPAQYGRPMYDTIRGSSFATSEASWDTHHGGIGHTFIGITAVGATNNQGVGNACFSLRGRNHQFINCTAHNATVGFRTHAESANEWATSQGHRLVGCSSRGTTQGLELSTMGSLPTGPNVTIDGGEFESSSRHIMYVNRARVALQGGVILRYTGQTRPSDGQWITLGLGEIRGSARLEARAYTGTIDQVIFCANTGTSAWSQIDLDLQMILSEPALSGTAFMINFATCRGEVRGTLNGPTSMVPITGQTLDASNQSATLRAYRSNSSASSSATVTTQVESGTALSHGRSGDPVVLFRLWSASARTAGRVLPAAFAGQMIVFVNANANGANITIPNGADYNTAIGADVTLTPGQSLTVMWDGTAQIWRAV